MAGPPQPAMSVWSSGSQAWACWDCSCHSRLASPCMSPSLPPASVFSLLDGTARLPCPQAPSRTSCGTGFLPRHEIRALVYVQKEQEDK